MRRSLFMALFGAVAVSSLAFAGPTRVDPRAVSGDISGTVTDSSSGQPLNGAQVRVAQGTRTVAAVLADQFGRFTAHNLPAGTYQLTVRYIGFREVTRSVTVGGSDLTGINFAMAPVAATLSAITVSATVPIQVDTRTGDQVFQEQDFHGAPTLTTSQVLQQSIAGAARAPTGEVHIRGQHAEYTYYIDGVPVPPGISGSLNELFEPQVVNQISFESGGWDAEYGNKNTAIINVTTRIPTGGFHADVGSYYGLYDAGTTSGERNFDGQSLSMSTNSGPWGFYIAGSRQFTDMRREPVLLDTTTNVVQNFHNAGTDGFGFGKIQFTPSTADVLSLDANWSRTHFEVAYDSTAGFSDDRQTDVNSFVNLGWHHKFGVGGSSEAGSELFGGLYYRYGSLVYVPNPADPGSITIYPDTVTLYNVAENRSFSTYGLKFDYTLRPQHETEFKVGASGSLTSGNENFATTKGGNGAAGPSSVSGLTGNDAGVYAQVAYSLSEEWEIRTGARFDEHTAPFAGTKTQLSPRFRLNYRPSPSTTIYAYYGRLFQPTNVEDLRSITAASQGGVAATPTLPERDNFYELAAVQNFDFEGLSLKLAGYHKDSSPGVDDATVGASAIDTPVNISEIHVNGIEAVLEARPSDSRFAGYINAALNHAYGKPPITGGFFTQTPPGGPFDLDHDQRLSITANATYSLNRFYGSVTEIVGSGLTNGKDPT